MFPAISYSETQRHHAKDSKQIKSLALNTFTEAPQSGYESQDAAGSIEERQFGDINCGREPSFAKFGHEFSDAIVDLNTASNKISQTLDTTYSSILQKFSVLQTTVNSLKELSATAQQLNVEFQSEGDDLLSESNRQIDSFNDFRDQAARIAELKERVNMGRENIHNLGDRVRTVRKRVEGWESVERERRQKTKNRLRFTLACVGCVFALVILLHILPLLWMDGDVKENDAQASRISMSSKHSRHIDAATDDTCPLMEKCGSSDKNCPKDGGMTPRKMDEL
ncbi:hypothetical protein K3495_g7283 [Podosphaera aphanis]|nr:hypothetical protein K3495_g7283 [Podosphaera aphanis]